jgi:hypothetical protein
MSVSRLITRSFKVRRLHTQSPSAAFTAALKKEDPVQRIKPLDPVFSSYYNSGKEKK